MWDMMSHLIKELDRVIKKSKCRPVMKTTIHIHIKAHKDDLKRFIRARKNSMTCIYIKTHELIHFGSIRKWKFNKALTNQITCIYILKVVKLITLDQQEIENLTEHWRIQWYGYMSKLMRMIHMNKFIDAMAKLMIYMYIKLHEINQEETY